MMRIFCAYDTLQASDVYIISVPTPFKDDDNEKIADLSYVENAARLVASKLKPGDLVILESTVPPMTTAKMTDLFSRREWDFQKGILYGSLPRTGFAWKYYV